MFTTLLGKSLAAPALGRQLTAFAKPASMAQFSSAADDKSALLDQIIASAQGIKDYNYKSYFTRRATEDKSEMDSFTVAELQARLDQMDRIKSVQNLYVKDASVVEVKYQQ